MANINTLLDKILKSEGSYINHPNDKGGPTNHGITIAALNEYTGRHNDAIDIHLLTEQSARCIYKKNYYQKPQIDKLPDLIQALVFDMAVNHGPKTAIQLMQSQLLHDGYPVGVIDGIIGTTTITQTDKACRQLGQTFIDSLVNRRIDRYKAIVKHDPSQKVFLDGWTARAETFRSEKIA